MKTSTPESVMHRRQRQCKLITFLMAILAVIAFTCLISFSSSNSATGTSTGDSIPFDRPAANELEEIIQPVQADYLERRNDEDPVKGYPPITDDEDLPEISN
ncbi:hypothetical protein HDU97_001515 [Phlyctochytrium planicorne]|nr:hypothetical protein HDU97_001515 [Phlyctochytrium planicorne]